MTLEVNRNPRFYDRVILLRSEIFGLTLQDSDTDVLHYPHKRMERGTAGKAFRGLFTERFRENSVVAKCKANRMTDAYQLPLYGNSPDILVHPTYEYLLVHPFVLKNRFKNEHFHRVNAISI